MTDETVKALAAYTANWLRECRRVLEDVCTEMNATGRGDARFRRLIHTMPRAIDFTAAAAIEQQAAKVEALEREVERLRAVARELDVVLGRRLCDGLNASGQPRCMKLAEAEKDARRYRGIRANWRMAPGPDMGGKHKWVPETRFVVALRGPTFDDAVDAAMQETPHAE